MRTGKMAAKRMKTLSRRQHGGGGTSGGPDVDTKTEAKMKTQK